MEPPFSKVLTTPLIASLGLMLVTGNQKHYPIRDFIITPAEMMEIIDNEQ